MTGEIFIKNLILPTSIGVTKAERSQKQNIVINIALSTDMSSCLKNDGVKDTVDYFSLHAEVKSLVENSSVNLIETLASNIANICLKDLLVKKAEVTIEKPRIVLNAESAGCKITFDKKDPPLE